MLQAINDKAKGCLGIAIIVVIGLTFSLWGIQSYLDDSGPQYAAKINDTEITSREFERTVSMKRASLQRESEGEPPIDDKQLRDETLSQLVNQRLLEVVTFENGYRIDNPFVAEKIRQQFTIDGEFDRERFEIAVRSLGMSVQKYEYVLRSEMRVNQMQTALTQSAFVTDQQVDLVAKLFEQTRDVAVLSFDVAHFSTVGEPGEEEIKQFYDANRSSYMVPEKVKVDYVELKSDSLTEGIEIDESQIKQLYDEYLASIAGREERKARHILILPDEDMAAAQDKIMALKKQLDEGADFAELAKQHSQDPASASQGGDLGWIAFGDMVKPFEDVLFGLDTNDGAAGKGAVSDVVETQFGLHLIKLDDVRSEEAEPLAVKRYQLEQEVRDEMAASLFYDQSERLATLAYENPDNLDLITEELGLKINTSEDFSRDKGEGLFSSPDVRSIAFSPLVLQDNSNSDIIEISPTHVVVLRLNEHTPEIPIPLDIVRSSIINRLKSKSGLEQTRSAAQDVKARIESGTDVDSFRSMEGVKVEVLSDLKRQDVERVSSPLILNSAFSMAPPADGQVSAQIDNLFDGNLALIVLLGTKMPDDVADDKLQSIKQGFAQENGNIDFTNALGYMRNNADIDINKNLIQE